MNITGVAASSGRSLSFAPHTSPDDDTDRAPSEIVTSVAVGCLVDAECGRLADCSRDLRIIGNTHTQRDLEFDSWRVSLPVPPAARTGHSDRNPYKAVS